MALEMFWGARPSRAQFDASRGKHEVRWTRELILFVHRVWAFAARRCPTRDAPDGRRDACAPLFMVAVRAVAVCKDLDLVWVWFYKDVAPAALFKCENPAK
jgi:hypothetical protein